MAFNSGFFDALESGGVYDREYSAASFAHYFSLLVRNGVFVNPATSLQVTAATNPNMTVVVNPGSCWINGYWGTVPAGSTEILSIAVASATLPRIDSIVAGLNLTNRAISLYAKTGTASSSPVAPDLVRDSDLYEIELAQILVAAGSASVAQSSITDMRQNTTRCGIVTGLIDQIDTTNLFAQFTSAFETWFEEIQDQLSGDIATSLQLQINAINSNFSPTGPIKLTKNIHYFDSIDDLPDNAPIGTIAFVKV